MDSYSKQKLIPLIFVSLWICFIFSTVKYSAMAQENVPETVNGLTASYLLANAKKLEDQKSYYVAWEEYRLILEKEPGNAEARKGLERLKRVFPYGSPNPIKDADIFTNQKISVTTYVLNTGIRVSGIPVEETSDTIRVQDKNIEMTIKKSDIKETLREEVDSLTVLSPEARYWSKVATVSEDDADGHFLLSIFSMVNGLTAQANLEYQKATALDQRYSLLFHSVRLQYLFDMGMAKLYAGSALSAKQYFEACAQEGKGTEIETRALKKIGECDERIALERLDKAKVGKSMLNKVVQSETNLPEPKNHITTDLGGGVKKKARGIVTTMAKQKFDGTLKFSLGHFNVGRFGSFYGILPHDTPFSGIQHLEITPRDFGNVYSNVKNKKIIYTVELIDFPIEYGKNEVTTYYRDEGGTIANSRLISRSSTKISWELSPEITHGAIVFGRVISGTYKALEKETWIRVKFEHSDWFFNATGSSTQYFNIGKKGDPTPLDYPLEVPAEVAIEVPDNILRGAVKFD